ncbi:hypothetical protein, partial [Veronia pacifica]|uniref:hypothetical protein n=1 Tax=Veronia pacifica TaxID=1080227 RepID=UPI001C31151C
PVTIDVDTTFSFSFEQAVHLSTFSAEGSSGFSVSRDLVDNEENSICRNFTSDRICFIKGNGGEKFYATVTVDENSQSTVKLSLPDIKELDINSEMTFSHDNRTQIFSIVTSNSDSEVILSGGNGDANLNIVKVYTGGALFSQCSSNEQGNNDRCVLNSIA